MQYLIGFAVLAFLIFVILKIFRIRVTTVFEYEKGLKYSHGKFKQVLEAGTHWYLGYFTTITKVDTRTKFVSITGQEILSADGVTLKISLIAEYEMQDVNIAVNKLGNPYEEALYAVLQLALRELISSAKIDDILEKRSSFSEQLMTIAAKRVEELGLKLKLVNIKDIMFPGELKKIFAQVAQARQEGLATLEKARGEVAALRCLANAAGMIKDNPVLLQLRALYNSGNTLVMGLSQLGTAATINNQEGKLPESKQS